MSAPRLAVALLLVATASVVAGCGSDQATASAGDVVAARAPATGRAQSFVVPTGRVDVVVGAPVGDLADDQTKLLHGERAPGGGSFVPVSVTYDIGGAPWGGQLATQPKPAEISVVIGATSYAVGSAYSLSGVAIGEDPDPDSYVAVTGTPSLAQVSVTVGYDGVTQSATTSGDRDPGAAAGLYDLGSKAPGGVRCPSPGWHSGDPALEVEVTCSISRVGRTPYYPGVGWAPAGQLWTVVATQVDLVRATQRGTTYQSTSVRDHSTLGTVAPTDPMTASVTSPGTVAGTLVFSTAIGSNAALHLRVAYDLTVSDQGPTSVPDERAVVLTRTVTLPT